MSTGYLVATILWAAWVGFSAGSVFFRAMGRAALGRLRRTPSWWPWLGAAKAAGAAGLLVGLFMPVIGVMAAIGLVLYFIGALATVMRPRVYSRSAVLLLL